MLNCPIFRERYPKDKEYTFKNLHIISQNQCPEAIAIIEQELNGVNSDFFTYQLEIDLSRHMFLTKLTDNTRYYILVEQEKYENEDFWEYYKRLFDDPNEDIYGKGFINNLLSIPKAVNIIKKLYNYEHIFDNRRNYYNLTNNYNSFELFTHYKYDISNAPRNVLDQILLQPHLIYLAYTWDYDSMREKNWPFKEELVAKVFHPHRLLKICEAYNIEFDELMDIY